MSIKEAIIILISDYRHIRISDIIEKCKKINLFSPETQLIDDFIVDKNGKTMHIEDCIVELKTYAAHLIAEKLEKI